MKVFLLIPEFDAGGVEQHALDLSRGLVDLGCEVTIISNGGRLVSRAEAAGIRHVCMPIHRKNPLSLFQVRPLRRFFEKEKPDIIHAHSRLPAWLSWLAWRKMNPGRRPRYVTSIHGANSVNAYSKIMTKGERVIVVSKFIKEYVLEHYPRMPAGRLRVVYQGVDERLFSREARMSETWLEKWEKEYPHLQGKWLLILPGRITRGKGHEDFLGIVKMMIERGLPVHGLVAGSVHPRRRSFYRKLLGDVKAFGLEKHISFLGNRDDLREWMMLSHIVYALSSVKEAFGRVVLEALMMGKPVIGYSQGGVEEQLALLFPQGQVAVGDVSAAAQLTEKFIILPPEPSAVPEEFTIPFMCRNILSVYKELMEEKS